jgi:cytoskeletal protein CcmA (bactofilin family)
MAQIQSGEPANSMIGQKSHFAGRFAVQGSLRIDGKFEGEALIVDKVFIGPRGKVKTNIRATHVVVEGILIGNIHATSRVLLLPTSKILGDIQTPELIIQAGTILKGRCIISHDSDQDAKEIIESLYEHDTD